MKYNSPDRKYLPNAQEYKAAAVVTEQVGKIYRQVEFPGAEFFNQIMLGEGSPTYAKVGDHIRNKK